jgi:glycine/D-amino acid oxidase-like deaminating enzyme
VRPDAIVVGAGIVGASIAYTLTEAGVRTLVLDASDPAGGATAAGMGHIVVMDDSDAQFALTSYSRSLLRDMLPQLPGTAEVDASGTLWVAEDEAQMQAVHDKHAYYSARGITSEILDPASLHAAEPNLREGLAGALRVPEDMVMYPPAFAGWLLREALARGATFTRARVQRIERGAVVTDDARHEAPTIVLATGAAAAELVPGLPVVPRRGHLVVTDRYPGFCHHQLVELGYLTSAHSMAGGASVAFNVQPRRTQQVLIGSSRELVGWDRTLNRELISRMLQRAIQFMPALEGVRAVRTWIGFRPATDDHLPLIGAWDAQPGLWLAVGHEGLGITTALGTARVLVDQILTRTPAIDAAPYAPSRIAAGIA